MFDFDEFETILDIDVVLLKLLFQESISLVEMRTETIIGIDDCESRIGPSELALTGESIPQLFGEKEVVTLEFSEERSRRNVVNCLASSKVVLISVWFRSCGFPRAVILVGEEGMENFRPSFFVSLDRFVVIVHSCGNDELIVLNCSTILQNHFVVLGIVLDDSLVF